MEFLQVQILHIMLLEKFLMSDVKFLDLSSKKIKLAFSIMFVILAFFYCHSSTSLSWPYNRNYTDMKCHAVQGSSHEIKVVRIRGSGMKFRSFYSISFSYAYGNTSIEICNRFIVHFYFVYT